MLLLRVCLLRLLLLLLSQSVSHRRRKAPESQLDHTDDQVIVFHQLRSLAINLILGHSQTSLFSQMRGTHQGKDLLWLDILPQPVGGRNQRVCRRQKWTGSDRRLGVDDGRRGQLLDAPVAKRPRHSQLLVHSVTSLDPEKNSSKNKRKKSAESTFPQRRRASRHGRARPCPSGRGRWSG